MQSSLRKWYVFEGSYIMPVGNFVCWQNLLEHQQNSYQIQAYHVNNFLSKQSL